MAVPRVSKGGTGGNHEEESGLMELEEGVVSTPLEGNRETVMGEVELLARSHPIVRLDFFKATYGFANHKHEDMIVETSKDSSHTFLELV